MECDAQARRWRNAVLSDVDKYCWQYYHSIIALDGENNGKHEDFHCISASIRAECRLFAAVFAMFYALILFFRGPLRRRRRRRRGLCLKCGYDLMGNESGVCPKCGAEVSNARS